MHCPWTVKESKLLIMVIIIIIIIETGAWTCLSRSNRTPINVQEHSMVYWKDNLYVFGGMFSPPNECPLWIYQIQVLFSCSLSTRLATGAHIYRIIHFNAELVFFFFKIFYANRAKCGVNGSVPKINLSQREEKLIHAPC